MRVYIRLETDETRALREWARREHRDPRDQAALAIRAQLKQLGLLVEPATTKAVPDAEH